MGLEVILLEDLSQVQVVVKVEDLNKTDQPVDLVVVVEVLLVAQDQVALVIHQVYHLLKEHQVEMELIQTEKELEVEAEVPLIQEVILDQITEKVVMEETEQQLLLVDLLLLMAAVELVVVQLMAAEPVEQVAEEVQEHRVQQTQVAEAVDMTIPVEVG